MHGAHDDNGMGNAGDTDCNSGVSMGDAVDNGESGIFNNTSVGLRTEGVPGVYFDNGNGSNGWFANVNGDRGFDSAVSNDGGDANSDSGVRIGKDEELNSDGNAASNGVLGGNNENKVVLNLVNVILFLGHPGGLCIKACNFFSWFLYCLPINIFLFPMSVDAYKPITTIILPA